MSLMTKKINMFLKIIKNKKILKKCVKKSLINNDLKKCFLGKYNFVVKYIISIVFMYSNSFLNIEATTGNYKRFYSIKSANLTNKFKNLNDQVLKYYYKIIISKLKFSNSTPIAIHFYNIKNYKWFVEKLSKKIFILITKFYKKHSYNGCRKKKIKRKKLKKWLSGLKRQTVNLLIFSS
jgi:hypothetical protein